MSPRHLHTLSRARVLSIVLRLTAARGAHTLPLPPPARSPPCAHRHPGQQRLLFNVVWRRRLELGHAGGHLHPLPQHQVRHVARCGPRPDPRRRPPTLHHPPLLPRPCRLYRYDPPSAPGFKAASVGDLKQVVMEDAKLWDEEPVDTAP